MKPVPFHPLHTQRLHLRKFFSEDVPVFFERLGSNQNVTKFMLWEPHSSIAQSENSIRKIMARYDSPEPYCWAITLAQSGELIGRIDLLHFGEANGSCSFAYMLGEDFWNQGYGTEALQAVFRFAFEQLDIRQIVADHFAENAASGAVMRKAGMTQCGIVPKKYEKHGSLHDAVCYRITKEDWNNQ